MKISRILAVILLLASLANADRLVMKDNTIRVGRLAGVEGGMLIVNVQGRTEKIPISSVSALFFDDAGSPVATVQSAVVQPSPRPIANTAVVDPLAPIASAFSQTVEGFRVELQRCSKQGSKSVLCNFKITNLQTDRPIGVHGRWNQVTYYVDDQGMQRAADMARIGTSQVDWGGQTAAVNDVAVLGSLSFPGVETGVNSLAKLVISFCRPSDQFNCGGPWFTAEFRKIPLQGN